MGLGHLTSWTHLALPPPPLTFITPNPHQPKTHMLGIMTASLCVFGLFLLFPSHLTLLSPPGTSLNHLWHPASLLTVSACGFFTPQILPHHHCLSPFWSPPPQIPSPHSLPLISAHEVLGAHIHLTAPSSAVPLHVVITPTCWPCPPWQSCPTTPPPCQPLLWSCGLSPSQAILGALGLAWVFAKPKPPKAEPKPWLSGLARPLHH
jgi:hypothetical protein